MSTLRTLHVRAPAIPTNGKRASPLATCTGSSAPTSFTSAIERAVSNVWPPSNERDSISWDTAGKLICSNSTYTTPLLSVRTLHAVGPVKVVGVKSKTTIGFDQD